MKYPVYNTKGEKTGMIDLPKKIFGVEPNHDTIYQTVVLQMSNRRQKVAHTKDREEVRGGGKKPWRQKGTGRARHGSIRSPIWKGGGVTFGPRNEKSFKKKINKKTKKKALFMVLSKKAKDNFLFVLEDIDLKEAKTKLMVEILKNLNIEKKVIIATLAKDKNVFMASRNIPKVSIMPVLDLNALDLLSSSYLVLTKEGIKSMVKATESSIK